MSWTDKDTNRLAILLHDSDFIDELTKKRPPLSGGNNEEIIANAKKAEGWEDCLKEIKGMAETTDESSEDAGFIPVEKADPK